MKRAFFFVSDFQTLALVAASNRQFCLTLLSVISVHDFLPHTQGLSSFLGDAVRVTANLRIRLFLLHGNPGNGFFTTAR